MRHPATLSSRIVMTIASWRLTSTPLPFPFAFMWMTATM
jgi:hypothetical protein